jgi:hypothetical protein
MESFRESFRKNAVVRALEAICELELLSPAPPNIFLGQHGKRERRLRSRSRNLGASKWTALPYALVPPRQPA